MSLDSIVQGMFGSPKPALIAALPAISADAAHVLDALGLMSTLDVRAGAQADHYLITHTLTDARFVLSGGAAVVPLVPLALPSLTANTAAITRDGLLVIDRHGFTLRLGRVARSGFGAAALAPRMPQGSPATAGGLVAAVVALATTSDRAVSGCAALDRVLCADVGAAPGCLAAACPTGLSVLATQLDAAFDAADGAGLDLYLSGSTPLVDMSAEGWADLLPGKEPGKDDHPAGVATWSADVRTSLGVTRIATQLQGRPAVEDVSRVPSFAGARGQRRLSPFVGDDLVPRRHRITHAPQLLQRHRPVGHGGDVTIAARARAIAQLQGVRGASGAQRDGAQPRRQPRFVLGAQAAGRRGQRAPCTRRSRAPTRRRRRRTSGRPAGAATRSRGTGDAAGRVTSGTVAVPSCGEKRNVAGISWLAMMAW